MIKKLTIHDHSRKLAYDLNDTSVSNDNRQIAIASYGLRGSCRSGTDDAEDIPPLLVAPIRPGAARSTAAVSSAIRRVMKIVVLLLSTSCRARRAQTDGGFDSFNCCRNLSSPTQTNDEKDKVVTRKNTV